AQTYDALNSILVGNNVKLEVTGKETLSLKAGSQIVLHNYSGIKNSYSGDNGSFLAISLEANNDDTTFDVSGSNAGIYMAEYASIEAAEGGAGDISLWGRSGLGISGANANN